MTFDEILEQIITLLKRQGKVSYRALKVRCSLDDEYLEALPDRRLKQLDDTITILGRLYRDCHAVARATREVAQAENNLIIEGSEATLVTSGLRFAKEHIVRVSDTSSTTEERFPVSPAYELEILAFEGELRGERSPLPDDQDSLQTVAVTQAVLQALEERRIVSVPAVA